MRARTTGRRSAARTAGIAPAGLLLFLLLCPRPGTAQDVAVRGGTVYPVSGAPEEGATVLVRNGVVRAVGTDVEVPGGVPVIDARGKVVTPGFFEAGTRTGLVEVGAVGDTRDYAVSGDPIRAAFDVADGVNPNSTLVPVTRAAGITTVVTRPAGGLISGQAAVIDLAGATVEEMLAARGAAMSARYGADAADAVGGARGSAALRLREVLEDARFWADNREAYRSGATRPVAASRLDLAALQPVLSGDRPLAVEVHRASDILTVLRIAEEYDVRLIVEGGTEAWMVADRLAERGVPVVVEPLTNLPGDFERLGARFDNAALLHRAGVSVILSTFDSHNARDLPLQAGNAVRFGLPWEAALRAVTLDPAIAYGLGDRYGSLEPGKVGNLVVWSGDPFETSTRVEAVVIRGSEVGLDTRQDRLFRRYRSLDGERPPAYRRPAGPAPGDTLGTSRPR